jgi:hypothetical protein
MKSHIFIIIIILSLKYVLSYSIFFILNSFSNHKNKIILNINNTNNTINTNNTNFIKKQENNKKKNTSNYYKIKSYYHHNDNDSYYYIENNFIFHYLLNIMN